MLKKKIFKNGLILIVEEIPKMASFSLGFTLKSGSSNENIKNNGIHHFIEHMLFKGSNHYSFKEIAAISDRMGGNLNAYTSKERTQLYIKGIIEKFDIAFDLLFDMMMFSIFKESEIQKEKEVILQEISEDKDNPQVHAIDLFFENALSDSSLGLPILGSQESVSGFSLDFIYNFYKKKYKPSNVIISIAGGITFQQVCDKVNSRYQGYQDVHPQKLEKIKYSMKNGFFVKENPNLEQIYCIIGQKTVNADQKNKYIQILINEILGSGMSSRLFQTIREEKGLAYSISSAFERSKSAGFLLINSIISKKRIKEYLFSVRDLLYEMKKDGVVDREELERAKDSIKSSVILGMENSLNIMRFNLNRELYLNSFTHQELLSYIDKTTMDDINQEIFSIIDPQNMFISLYGCLKEGDIVEF